MVQIWSTIEDKDKAGEIQLLATHKHRVKNMVTGLDDKRALILLSDGTCLDGDDPNFDKSKKFKSIHSGIVARTFFAIGQNNKIYATGNNEHNQFGMRTMTRECNEWVEIKNAPPNTVQIATCLTCSFFLTADGRLYTAGMSESGCLGLGQHVKYSPTQLIAQVPIPCKIKSIQCGGDYCIALDLKGRVWSWGRNAYGQCGQGHTKNIWVPTLIKSMENIKIKQISAVLAHSVALSSIGRVL